MLTFIAAVMGALVWCFVVHAAPLAVVLPFVAMVAMVTLVDADNDASGAIMGGTVLTAWLGLVVLVPPCAMLPLVMIPAMNRANTGRYL